MKKKQKYGKIFLEKFLITILFSLIVVFSASASDLTSTNFIIRDPMIGTGGDYGTSSNFKMYSSGNTLFSDAASSSSFLGHFGFLYYPSVSVGTLTATPVGAQVDLSWGASSATNGWSVSGYNTGIASVSGGPYTYTSVGNVLSYSYTALAPGNYCFVVQTLDALGYVIGTSNESCATVSQVITFDLDTAADFSNGESGAPYTVPLGTLSAGSVTESNTTSIRMIVAESDTNAASGINITVSNANGASGLKSTSVPGDTIPSATATMAAGTANYGLCVATSGLTGFTRATGYVSDTCALSSSTNGVRALSTTPTSILTTTTPVYSAHAEIVVNAAISNTTPAHTDYADTLTFIATSTF